MNTNDSEGSVTEEMVNAAAHEMSRSAPEEHDWHLTMNTDERQKKKARLILDAAWKVCPLTDLNAFHFIVKRAEAAEAEVARLSGLINMPHTDDWLSAVKLEAAHQRERYAPEHDASKTPFDWFWLIGYLAQKAASAQVADDETKARHHTISTGAALLNWFRHIEGVKP